MRTQFKIVNMYKGVSYPLLTNSMVSSLNFGIFNYFKANRHYNTFVSGGLSGVVTGFVLCPIEYYKIRSQLNLPKMNKIFTGVDICLMREIPAYALYFQSYEKLRSYEISIMNAGGIAGMISWIVTYPIDVIKTRIQSGNSECIQSAIKKGKLYRGMSISLLREIKR